MSEGISLPNKEGDDGSSSAGGLGPQAVPQVTKFFLIEYFDEVRRGLRWMRGAPKPEKGIVPRVAAGLQTWSKGRKARMGVVAIAAIMIGAWVVFAGQAANTDVDNGPGGGGGGGGGGSKGNYTNTSTVGENSNITLMANFNGPGIFKSMTATLTWTDQAGSVGQTNQPDQLGFDLIAPNGKNWSAGMATNPVGGAGRVTWSLNDTAPNYGAAGWQIIVKGGTMGDYVRPTGRPCVLCPADNTNSFTVTVDYTY